MNHNGTIDRFENDELADYPYKRGQQGYNLYGGLFLGPDIRLSLGRMRTSTFADKRHNRAVYLLLTADHDYARLGRLRLFQDLRRVKDTIADDLLQWQQLPNTRGDLRQVPDLLAAPDTWINATWAGWNQDLLPGLRLEHKIKWTLWHQRESNAQLTLRGMRRSSGFFGLINKAEYSLNLGRLVLTPRWKSEFRRIVPAFQIDPRLKELSELFIVLGRLPVMRRSFIEAGIEYELFNQMRQPPPPGANPDFKGITYTVQLSNQSEYQGYRLTTTAGFLVNRISFDFAPVETRTRGFITIYAGVQQ
jgi:hypothetical protein